MTSIRRQLTLTLLPGFILLLVGGSIVIYFLTRAALLREFDASLRSSALTIMSLTEQGRDRIQLEIPDRLFQGLNRDATPQFFQLWGANGVTITRSASLKEANLPLRSGSLAAPEFWDLPLPDTHSARAIGLRFTPKIEDEDNQHPASLEAILVVAASRQSLDHTLASLATILAATDLLTILITIPLVKFSLRRGHVPLAQLARQAGTITADSLQTRFPVESLPAELQPIAARLNDLLSRLHNSFERERRFSADLAHELRTPLAELRAHAEVALEWPDGEATEKHHQTLEIALQMESLVTSLLELSRSENGKLSPQPETIPLAPFIEKIWRANANKGGNKRFVLVKHLPSDATLQTDPTLLRSILTNLLSNVAEYTPPDGHIEIRWTSSPAELTISNTTHDLTPADLPHLFERLWRKDLSRTGTAHSGLGLPLSRAFAELLGFELSAHLNGNQNVVFSLKRRP